MRVLGVLLSLVTMVALAACEKPCPVGQQRYGADCVKSPVADAGSTDAASSGGNDTDSDSACALDGGPLFLDQDGDGYGSGAPRSPCAGVGFVGKTGDCDDTRPLVYPTAAELCNGVDDDCDDQVDESLGNACDMAACASLGCDANAVCSMEGPDWRCKCAAGFTGNGMTCENIDDCADSPCRNGGTCVDGVESRTCKCAAGFTGDDCELEICGSLFIRTEAELEASRACAEIQGDLSIDPNGFSAFDETDLPNLRKVTGQVSIAAGFNSPIATPALASMTLSALEVIGGSLFMGSNPAQEIHFPSLRTVGTQGDPNTRALYLLQLIAKVVTFPKLETIGGEVELNSLQQLCSANFRQVSSVAGKAVVRVIPKLPRVQVEPILSAAKSITQQLFGCCIYLGGTADCADTGLDPFAPTCQCTN